MRYLNLFRHIESNTYINKNKPANRIDMRAKVQLDQNSKKSLAEMQQMDHNQRLTCRKNNFYVFR